MRHRLLIVALFVVVLAGCGEQRPPGGAQALPEQGDVFAGLDRGLVGEITAWQKGNPPPPRLLHFPEGPPAVPPLCGLPVFGASVEDYVSRISNGELLRALLFDPRANTACVRACARRLLELRGVTEVRAMLAERRRTNPGDFAGTELATLNQLLTSPYVRIRVASIEKKDVPKEAADKALAALQADLAEGVPWQQAYRTAADLLFDKERSRKEGGGWRTFLCYRYEGLVSPTGFDLLNRRISDQLDAGHVRKLFEAKRNVHRLETADAWWLYYVEASYK
jgi:hypothetical protein